MSDKLLKRSHQETIIGKQNIYIELNLSMKFKGDRSKLLAQFKNPEKKCLLNSAFYFRISSHV